MVERDFWSHRRTRFTASLVETALNWKQLEYHGHCSAGMRVNHIVPQACPLLELIHRRKMMMLG